MIAGWGGLFSRQETRRPGGPRDRDAFVTERSGTATVGGGLAYTYTSNAAEIQNARVSFHSDDPAQAEESDCEREQRLCHGGRAGRYCDRVDAGGWTLYLGVIPIVLAPEPSLPCPTNLSSTAASTSPLK